MASPRVPFAPLRPFRSAGGVEVLDPFVTSTAGFPSGQLPRVGPACLDPLR